MARTGRPRSHPEITCSECGDSFSPLQKVAGRVRRLYHRRKCLSCQPFKAPQKGTPRPRQRTFNPEPEGLALGEWTVLVEVHRDKGRGYLCRCSCGHEQVFAVSYLNTGRLTACKFCQARQRDEDAASKMVGLRRGRYTVLSRHGNNKSGSRTWLCRCDCGRQTVYTTGQVLSQGNQRMSCAACWQDNLEDANRVYSPPARFWSRFLAQAKRRSLLVTISQDAAADLFGQQKCKCALSGSPIHFTKLRTKFNRYTTASLDRIDSTKPYEEGNVQWVHKQVNLMKGSLPQSHFVDWCLRVASHVEVPS